MVTESRFNPVQIHQIILFRSNKMRYNVQSYFVQFSFYLCLYVFLQSIFITLILILDVLFGLTLIHISDKVKQQYHLLFQNKGFLKTLNPYMNKQIHKFIYQRSKLGLYGRFLYLTLDIVQQKKCNTPSINCFHHLSHFLISINTLYLSV